MPLGVSGKYWERRAEAHAFNAGAASPDGPMLWSKALILIPTATLAHRPIELPDCRRFACRDEKCEPPPGDNRGPSIGLWGIRRLPRAAANNPRVIVSQFRWRSL